MSGNVPTALQLGGVSNTGLRSPSAQYLTSPNSAAPSVPNSGRSSRMSFKGKYGGSPRITGSGSPRRLSQQLVLDALSSPASVCLGAPAVPQAGVVIEASVLSAREGNKAPAPLQALDLEAPAASPVTPSRQRILAYHGSPTASALKARKRSNYSSLLTGGGGLYSSERLLESGTKFPNLSSTLSESIMEYRSCCHAMGDYEEARLDPTPTVVLQCKYGYEGGDETAANYATVTATCGRIDASLVVTGHQMLSNFAESGRYAVSHSLSDDGACGCSEGEITRNDRGMDYSRFHSHNLFKECHICARQPATFLCLTSLKAVCASHVEAHYNADNRHSLFINLLDIVTSYDRMFWCERCRRFTWKYTDVYEALTDQLAYTRGTYWGCAVRDITATAYHVRSAPTTPNSHDGLHLCAVAASAQGWRATQEDAEAVFMLRVPIFGAAVTTPLLGGSTNAASGRFAARSIDHMSVFAVFDGHGGDAIARIASSRIEGVLQAKLLAVAKEQRDVVPDELEDIRGFYAEVFEDALLSLDAEIRASEEGRRGDYNCVGSTACIVGVTNSYIVCANLGDSGAALYSRHDATLVPLSHPHRLSDPLETSRVKASGYSIRDDRIEGLLAVPRALGDYEFKQTMGSPKEQAVIACPTVKVIRTPPSFSHRQRDDGTTPIPWGLLVACDGVWDTLTMQQVSKVTSTFSLTAAALVHAEFEEGAIPQCLPEPLMPNLLRVYAQCIAPTNNDEGVGVDNVSVIFVEPCPLAPRRVSGVDGSLHLSQHSPSPTRKL